MAVNEVPTQQSNFQGRYAFLSEADLLEITMKACKQVINEKKENELANTLLSPKETCSLFKPKISLSTLSSWTKSGYLKSYNYGGRVYYKYTEIIAAGDTLKKYQKPQIAQK